MIELNQTLHLTVYLTLWKSYRTIESLLWMKTWADHSARNNADRKRVILLEQERRRRRRRRRRRQTSPNAARLGKIQRRTTFLFILHPRMWTLNDIELFIRDRLFAFHIILFLFCFFLLMLSHSIFLLHLRLYFCLL